MDRTSDQGTAGVWILEVFGPALIELRTIRVRELERAVSLDIRETLPQGHRQFSAVTGWQLEKLRQRGSMA